MLSKIRKNSKKAFLCLRLLIELLAVKRNDLLEYEKLTLIDFCFVVVDRHHGRLIFLEYVGEGEINTTVMLVGKGITYDTGGLDIKGKRR